MPINLRGVGTVPDGSITTAKLANNAVDSTKLADNAVSTNKIQDDAVDTTKITSDIARQHFLGYETDLTWTGTTETSIADFNFTKTVDNNENWKSFGYNVAFKSNNASNTASVNFYIDGVLQSTESTNATVLEYNSQDALDLSSLTADTHHFEVKFVNSQVSGITTVSKLDVYLGKK